MAGLFDALFSGIGDAIADIRQRVVEEGWFGRIVTGDPVEVTRRSDYRDIQPEGRSFEDMWAADPGGREHAAPERDGPEIDR